jgi:PPIC-type PPIASE domain
MRGFWLVGVLIAAMAWAQMNSATPVKSATPGATSNAAPASGEAGHSGQATAPAASIAPDAAVLTIKGLCTQSESNSATRSTDSGCETVITRAQFEKLVEVLHAEKDSQTRFQLATAYPLLLVMAHEAERRGVDKEARFQERLRFARVQILSQELTRELREQTTQVPEKDIADYYRENASEFEEVTVERIVIPNRAQKDLPGAEAGNKSSEDAITAEAEALRTRAVQGESFTKLQKDAYDFAGMSGDSEPNPKMDKMRRRGLPLTHAAVFDLKAGQVSPVISDATGHYIYKVDSRDIVPLDSVKQEITIVLRRQQMQNVIQAIQRPFTTDINKTYFGDGKDED